MRYIADLHIHSKYSRGCSKDLGIDNLERYAKIKGLNLLGTGDFTHPKWIEELKSKLTDNGDGIFQTKNGFDFVLQTELSLIYSQDGKGRRIHNIVLAPDFEAVDQINDLLLQRGRLDYDGRPIFKIPCPEFVELMKEADKRVEVIPAHIWTPWFSLFGAKNEFDTVEDCFGDQTKHIHAMETGLSSDPAMNWRVSQLDKYTLISNSDLHSFWPWRIGRECNIIDIEPTYDSLLNMLHTKEGLKETIEFWPDEGKYHYDGHRSCGVVLSPAEAISMKNQCPRCNKGLTIGVAHRVEELADKKEGRKPTDAIPFKNLIPLSEVISGFIQKGVATKSVWSIYNTLIERFGNEMNILLDSKKKELREVVDSVLADMIIKNRTEGIQFAPGFDGVYGIPKFNGNEDNVPLPKKLKKKSNKKKSEKKISDKKKGGRKK